MTTEHSCNRTGETDIESFFSGDGREIKRKKKVFTYSSLMQTPPYGNWIAQDNEYYIRSTVLGGQVIWEIGPLNIFAGGTRIAAGSIWMHQDANGHTLRSTDTSGIVLGDGSYPDAYWYKKELDPDGKQTGMSAPLPYNPTEDNTLYAPMNNFDVISYGQYQTYTMDGINVPADFLAMRLDWANPESSAGVIGPSGAFLPLQRIGNSWFIPSHEATWNLRQHVGWEGQTEIYNEYSGSLGAANFSVLSLIQPEGERRLTKDETDALKSNLTKLMSDEKCRNFIRSVVDNLPGELVAETNAASLVFEKFTGSILDKFDVVNKSRGFWVKPMQEGTAAVNNGDLIGFNQTHFGPTDTSPKLKSVSARFRQNTPFRISTAMDTTLTLVHELIHGYYQRSGKSSANYSGYLTASHEEMGRAGLKRSKILV